MGRLIDLTGRQFGDWLVIDRADNLNRNGIQVVRWNCRCTRCCNVHVVEGSNLRAGRTTRCWACHDWPGAPRTDTPGYDAAHARIHRERGRAADYACVDCDAPAAHWSLDAYRPDDLLATRRNSVVRYAPDSTRYAPRCQPCHQRHDAALRQTIDQTTTTGSADPSCTEQPASS